MPESELLTKPPRSKAAMFRLCSELAQIILQMGYTEDLGYQSFLYPNPVEVKKLFLFLIERLPSAREPREAENKQEVKSLEFNIHVSLKKEKNRLVIPYSKKSSPKLFTSEILRLPWDYHEFLKTYLASLTRLNNILLLNDKDDQQLLKLVRNPLLFITLYRHETKPIVSFLRGFKKLLTVNRTFVLIFLYLTR
jgi:hypothetical protein